MKILIVEDDTSSRIYLERALISQGYEVETALNGLIALQKVESSPPGIIISDIMMPEMDGFELCRRLKSDNRTSSIPFVFYTATFIERKDQELANALGASRFLVKPMDPDEFLRIIKEVIEEHKNKGLPVYEQPNADITSLDRMQIEALARKLWKKVDELSREREALRISEQKYRRLYESLMDGYAVTDMEGRILDCNHIFHSMLGYAPEELRTMTYRHITPEGWHEYEDNIIREQVLVKGCSEVYEKEFKRKDGMVFPVEVRAFLIKNEQGMNEGMWAIVRDITDKKHALKEREKLQEHIHHAQRLECIGHLASGIAHDFNNILNAVIGFGNLLKMKLGHNEALKPLVNEVLEAAHRGTAITNQILAFSRKQSLDMKHIDLNYVIRDIEKLLRRLIREDISMRLDLSEKRLTINADSSQIDQVLMNLVTNARDAMPNGGSITISTNMVFIDGATGLGHSADPGKYAAIYVTDTGIGMDKDTVDKVFDPFFTTKSLGHGTGLGLAVVYGIIKQHKGFVEVQSEPGAGSTFSIFIPMVATGVLESQESLIKSPEGGTETILIAEDDVALREYFRIFLQEYGYNVITAKNGQEAIERFSEQRDNIHLCIFDVMMPIINGIELSERIRMMRPDAKLILMSGYHGDTQSDRDMKDKCILSKPVHPDTLLKKIREVLDN